MKCPKCGAANLSDAEACRMCKEPLPKADVKAALTPATHRVAIQAAVPANMKASMTAEQLEEFSKFVKNLQERCPLTPADQSERIMEQIQKLLEKARDPSESIESFLTHAGTMIYRMFGIAEIAIALKDERDGLFRYRLFFGMRKEAAEAYKRIAYDYDDVISNIKYPRIRLTDNIDFYPGEFRPYAEGELDTYNRPSQMGQIRPSMDDLMEGDYLGLYMHGFNNEIIGWVEIARTRDNKIPSHETFKWLDLFVTIIGRVVYERMFCGKLKGRRP